MEHLFHRQLTIDWCLVNSSWCQVWVSLSLLLFLYLFVIVFAVFIVFFLVYICQWYQYIVDGGRDAGNSRPSSQLRYRPLRCAIHWWHLSQSGFELSWQEWIISKKLRWAIAKRRQRSSDWVSDHQPPTLMISWYILYITCIVYYTMYSQRHDILWASGQKLVMTLIISKFKQVRCNALWLLWYCYDLEKLSLNIYCKIL